MPRPGLAIAQALRRIAALERRYGVTVERVMVPPYEACSQAALRAMFRLGIEAACHTRPIPMARRPARCDTTGRVAPRGAGRGRPACVAPLPAERPTGRISPCGRCLASP